MVEQGRQRSPWEAVGAIAAVVGVVVAIVVALRPDDSRPPDGPDGPTTVTVAPPTADTQDPDPWSDSPTPAGNSPGVTGESPSNNGATHDPNPPEVIVAAQPAIQSVAVVPRAGNGILTKVGPNTWELPSYPSSVNPPRMTFDWASQGPGGKVNSDDCAVSVQIDGPAPHFPQSDRSSECSGSPNSRPDVYDPGQYTVTITVSPPDGGGAVTGSASFTLVPQGG